MLKVIEGKRKEFRVAPQWIEQYNRINSNGLSITVKGHLVHKDAYHMEYTCHFSDYFNEKNLEGKYCTATCLFPYVGGKEKFYK